MKLLIILNLIFLTSFVVCAPQTPEVIQIVSILNPPFLQLKDGVAGHYEGFIYDLATEISTRSGRKFDFVFTEDHRYGSFNPKTGKWDGMIGYLLDNKADLIFADLTVSEMRKEAVQFTVPFLHTGVGILYKNTEHTIHNFEELVNSGIPFGVVRGGSTYAKIKASDDAVFKKAAEYLDAHHENLVSSQSEGVERAVAEDFAFLTEAATFPRIFGKHPELSQVGDLVFKSEYAVGYRKDAPSTRVEYANEVLTGLRTDGTLDKLLRKWGLKEN